MKQTYLNEWKKRNSINWENTEKLGMSSDSNTGGEIFVQMANMQYGVQGMGYPSGTKHINKYNVALRGFKMKGLNLETGTQNEDLISSQ